MFFTQAVSDGPVLLLLNIQKKVASLSAAINVIFALSTGLSNGDSLIGTISPDRPDCGAMVQFMDYFRHRPFERASNISPEYRPICCCGY